MSGRATIASPVELAGVGLHRGVLGAVRIEPAPPGSGRVFVLPGPAGGQRRVPAALTSVVAVERAIALGDGTATVVTVEHLLAALYGLGVDDAELVVEGPEIPALDGSAAPFVAALEAAGLVEVGEAEVVRPRAVALARDGDRVVSIAPGSPSLEVIVAHPGGPNGRLEVSLDRAGLLAVAAARTYGFADELDGLRARGLAAGASLDNAVLFSGAVPVNPGGLRFPDEVVRHRALDVFGGLALLGARLAARVTSHLGGHALDVSALRALASQLAATTGADAS